MFVGKPKVIHPAVGPKSTWGRFIGQFLGWSISRMRCGGIVFGRRVARDDDLS
jgi:hypothetical protein